MEVYYSENVFKYRNVKQEFTVTKNYGFKYNLVDSACKLNVFFSISVVAKSTIYLSVFFMFTSM